jgi:D-3-phosphoglycerate dehydrogenase
MLTYIWDPISGPALAYAKDKLDVVLWDDPDAERIHQAEAIMVRTSPMTPAVIDSFPRLRIISRYGVGIDTIDIDYAKAKGIIVTNTPNANSNSVAELIIGMALDCAHKITASHMAAQQGVDSNWPSFLSGYEVTGKTLGLIGVGRIGTIVGTRLRRGFDMQVKAYSPSLTEERCASLGFVKAAGLEDIYRTCDIISISVPLTDATRHMIGRQELAMMKQECILINAARGGIIDEAALAEALQEKKIWGAAIDVFAQQPVSRDNPLLKCFNFVGTPHNGANTSDALLNMGVDAVDEIVRVEQGLPTKVNLTAK